VRLDHLLSKESRVITLTVMTTPSWSSLVDSPLFCFEGAIPLFAEAPPLRGQLVAASSCLRVITTLLENCIASTSIFVLPSYKEPTVDALAPDTDEGRGWLRKATGSCRPSFDPWMSEWGNPAPVMGCHSGLNT
jgi:hypothetical protein